MRRTFAVLLVACACGPTAAQEESTTRFGFLAPFRPVATPSDKCEFRVEYLTWYLSRLPVPPLATTGGTGVVGDPGTVILRGGELESRHDRYIGVRTGGEYWFGAGDRFGIDGAVTILERDSSNITYPYGSYPLLARPYVDAATSQPRAEIIAGHDPARGDLTGSINVYSRIEFFTEDVNAAVRLVRSPDAHINLLAGARFIQMRERLDVTATSRVLPAQAVLYGEADHFQTFDRFYGGQVGWSGDLRFGRFTLDGKGTLAIGGDDQIIAAKGDRVFHTPAGRQTSDVGLLVQQSNTGTFERGQFDFVTEWCVNLGYRWTDHVRTRVGYTLLTWNNSVRPGDQIDALDLTSGTRPRIPFRTSFFWAQGLNLGLEANW
jgi:hypothetical protein